MPVAAQHRRPGPPLAQSSGQQARPHARNPGHAPRPYGSRRSMPPDGFASQNPPSPAGQVRRPRANASTVTSSGPNTATRSRPSRRGLQAAPRVAAGGSARMWQPRGRAPHRPTTYATDQRAAESSLRAGSVYDHVSMQVSGRIACCLRSRVRRFESCPGARRTWERISDGRTLARPPVVSGPEHC